MLGLTPETKVFIKPGVTDGRYGLEALRGLIVKTVQQSPTSGHLFCFANRARTRMKLVWHREGVFYLTTCLIEGTFDFPRDETAARTISWEQLEAMLRGRRFKRLARFEQKAALGPLSNGGYRR
jgi:IS66 Orf2 like protein